MTQKRKGDKKRKAEKASKPLNVHKAQESFEAAVMDSGTSKTQV